MKTTISFFILLLFFLGCSSSNKTSKTKVSENSLNSYNASEAINKFGLELYKATSSPLENLFFSPYSISSAMNMVYLGARGTTSKEFQTAMFYGQNTEAHHAQMASLNDSILRTNSKSENLIRSANALWIQNDFPLKNDYQTSINKWYSKSVEYANFLVPTEREEARIEVNQWVEEQTNNKIKNLIGEGILDENTRMILVNAIYFLGKWQTPFIEGMTQKKAFFGINGSESQQYFMQKNLTLPYAENEEVELIALPYQKNEFSMYIMLKKDRNEESPYKTIISDDILKQLINTCSPAYLHLEIPKFRIEQTYDLVNTFKTLGMKEAFSLNANFSGMREKNDLKISNILHKSFVEVNEEGTEAAAATGIIMSLKAAHMPPEKKFIANHPFMFFIRHNATGTLLFLGELNTMDK